MPTKEWTAKDCEPEIIKRCFKSCLEGTNRKAARRSIVSLMINSCGLCVIRRLAPTGHKVIYLPDISSRCQLPGATELPCSRSSVRVEADLAALSGYFSGAACLAFSHDGSVELKDQL